MYQIMSILVNFSTLTLKGSLHTLNKCLSHCLQYSYATGLYYQLAISATLCCNNL